MAGFPRKLAVAALAAASLMLLLPRVGSATVTGGCDVSGVATVSGTTNLTDTAVWHLKAADDVTGTATYPEQTKVKVHVLIFGIPYQIYESSGKDTHGSAGPFLVSDYSKYTRVFAAGGASDSCAGLVVIVVDDQNPFTTYLGIAGTALSIIGIILLLLLAFAAAGQGVAAAGSLA